MPQANTPTETHAEQRRTISGRMLGWRGHRCETDGTSFRTLCGCAVPTNDAVTLLCGDPEPNCDTCFVAIGGDLGEEAI